MIATGGATLVAFFAVWSQRARIVAQFAEPQGTYVMLSVAGGMLLGILASTSERRADLSGPMGFSVVLGLLSTAPILASKTPHVAALAMVLGWAGFFCVALVASIVSAFTPH